jgi:HEAT repeat protein
MGKRLLSDERMDALAKLRGGGLTPEAIELLKSSLGSKANLIVARAAAIVREMNASALVSDLVAAFERFMSEPQSDKGCQAMSAIAEALQSLGAVEAELYLRGIRHVQLEASYGGPSDVAAKLRCECAFGLVRMGYRDVMWELAGLLADPDKQCRIAAARAIGHSEADAGMALLKYKILSLDRDEDVAAECLASMPQIDAVKSIPFLAGFLESSDEQMSEAAALALGSTRRPEAFELLRAQWDARIDARFRETLALAMGMLRNEAAVDFLVGQISTAGASVATVAIKALAFYRRDDGLRARVAEVVAKRSEAAIREVFEAEFR